VTYHESLYLAIAAAAPVIALAHTVTITDVGSNLFESKIHGHIMIVRFSIACIIAFTTLNFALQTASLYNSLESLMNGKNYSSDPTDVLFAPVIGLLILFVLIAWNIGLKFLLRYEENIAESNKSAAVHVEKPAGDPIPSGLGWPESNPRKSGSA
jgi:hypothetical protein